MKAFVLLLLLPVLFAQQQGPPGVLRGKLLEWQGISNVGTITFEGVNGRSYLCRLDRLSYVEREHERIAPGSLRSGERLEVISDQRPDGGCYARTVHLLDDRTPVVNPGYRVRLPQARPAFEFSPPRGNLTFTGVVVRVTPEHILLHTRAGLDKTILLRTDTRYIENGTPCDQTALLVNTRVFVRGGTNLEDKLEAYQVVWGEIAGPKPY